jgi:hypothetical protein
VQTANDLKGKAHRVPFFSPRSERNYLEVGVNVLKSTTRRYFGVVSAHLAAMIGTLVPTAAESQEMQQRLIVANAAETAKGVNVFARSLG